MAEGQYPLPPLAVPPSNNRTWLIVIVVIVVLCCCCFGSLGLIFAFFQDIQAAFQDIFRQLGMQGLPPGLGLLL